MTRPFYRLGVAALVCMAVTVQYSNGFKLYSPTPTATHSPTPVHTPTPTVTHAPASESSSSGTGSGSGSDSGVNHMNPAALYNTVVVRNRVLLCDPNLTREQFLISPLVTEAIDAYYATIQSSASKQPTTRDKLRIGLLTQRTAVCRHRFP